MRFEYPVNIEEEAGEFLASFVDFPEVVTGGASLQEALEEAEDALEEAIAGRINRNESIPEPKQAAKSEQYFVPVQPQFAMKAFLHMLMLKKKLSKTDLAKMVELDEKEVRRMLDSKHNTKLVRLQSILKALGGRVAIDAYEIG